jgi:hypothetical protein
MKKVKAGIALLFATVLLVLAGCPQEEAEEYSDDVSLRSITVANTPARGIPQGIPRALWEIEDFKASTMDIAHVVFPLDRFDTEGYLRSAQVAVGVAEKTEIWYFKTSGGLKPADDAQWTQQNTFDFKDSDSVYLQVTSANKKKQAYYRIQIHAISTEASIKALIIGGKNTSITDVDGSLDLNTVTLGAVNLAFGIENINARIEATKADNGADVQFLRVEADQTPDPVNFSATAVYNLDDGDIVYVKVTSSTGETIYYYGATVTSLRLSAVNIGGININITGSGSPNADTADEIPVLITTSSKLPDLVVTQKPGVSIEYAYGQPEYLALTDETEIEYVDSSILYIKAKADGFKDIYYKFAVAVKQNIATLQSATINSAYSPEELPTPAATWAAAAAMIYPLGGNVPTTVTLAAIVTAGTNGTVKYGKSASNTATPEWGESGAFSSPNSGDYIGVEVTAEDGLVKQYYKWRLSFGSNVAGLKDAGALYIAGVPNASLGTSAGTYNGTGITSGAIYLNSTQTAIGKSVVVYTSDTTVSAVEISSNNITNDTTAPNAWAIALTRDSTDGTKWTGAWAGTALANNRRFYIRVTAQDTVTQSFYRFLVTYQANYSILSALTIDNTTVVAASRGTPAGSWNAGDLVPGNYFTNNPIPNPLPVTFTWQTGGTNATSYAVTSVFPPASEPTWNTGTTPLSVSGVTAGNYIWIRGINNTNSNNSYRNIYVIRVGPPPFTATVAGQALAFTDLGTAIAPTGNTNVGGNPTPMGKIFLTEQEMASVAVSTSTAIVGDAVKVISYRIPESGGTTVNTTAQVGAYSSATNGGTFNLNAGDTERGLPVLQFQHTGAGSTASTYYNVVPRKSATVSFASTAPVIDGELDAIWNTATEITIDRVATDTTATGVAAATDRGRPAKVKLLWDDTGIYYYARVYDSNIGVTGTDYNRDCIEFFKHENWTSANPPTGNNWNGQYRIDASVSGVAGANLSGDATASNTSGFLRLMQDSVADADKGYIIEAKINWTAAAGTVAGWSTGENIKEVGIEFQIAYSIGSTRNVCMSWNNRFGANYQQSANAGRIILTR